MTANGAFICYMVGFRPRLDGSKTGVTKKGRASLCILAFT